MLLSPKLAAVVALAVISILLIVGALVTLTQPSVTIYLFIFPVATVGPGFMVYLGGFVMLVAGIVLAYLTLRAGM